MQYHSSDPSKSEKALTAVRAFFFDLENRNIFTFNRNKLSGEADS